MEKRLYWKNNYLQQFITLITADSTTSESTRNCERLCLTEKIVTKTRNWRLYETVGNNLKTQSGENKLEKGNHLKLDTQNT